MADKKPESIAEAVHQAAERLGGLAGGLALNVGLARMNAGTGSRIEVGVQVVSGDGSKPRVIGWLDAGEFLADLALVSEHVRQGNDAKG
jgi:hypothetical protein